MRLVALGAVLGSFYFVFLGDPVGTSRDLNNKELEKKIPGFSGDELWGKGFQHWTPSHIPSSCTTSKICLGRPCRSLISDLKMPGHLATAVSLSPREVLTQNANPSAGSEQCKESAPELCVGTS